MSEKIEHLDIKIVAERYILQRKVYFMELGQRQQEGSGTCGATAATSGWINGCPLVLVPRLSVSDMRLLQTAYCTASSSGLANEVCIS